MLRLQKPTDPVSAKKLNRFIQKSIHARYKKYSAAPGIHASCGIPYILYIATPGIHASRGIPYILYIKTPTQKVGAV